jgi:phenylalanyl-tRNA synthetase beta chain
MRVPLSWLKEYVDLVLPPDELAHRLTMAGIEVEEIEQVGAAWGPVYVGQVVALRQHPNADRLLLAELDLGERRLQAVTGAPNLRVGAKVPVALPGARLASGSDGAAFTVRPATLRGERSECVVCSEKELGLGEDHSGILILDASAPLGRPLGEVLGDTVFVLKLSPNRADCLAMLGVAREVAALTDQPLRQPEWSVVEEGPAAASFTQVEILDPDLCPRYIARIITGVRVGPSPRWLQDRLRLAGMRPINNIVDITNYVMLEIGQPLHAFDYERLAGRRIVVRRARAGERLTTLDGVDRALSPDMLAIADAERPVAIAGVMGGLDSEVTESTTTILLESASFHPTSVRRTARALRLPSEAARRFERTVPVERPPVGAARAAELMRQIAGGRVAPGAVDAYPRPRAPRRIHLALAEVSRLLGQDFAVEAVERILGRLGFATRRADGALDVTVPSDRVDVELPADLVEEVARVVGYDSLPTTLPRGEVPAPIPSPELAFEERLRDMLVACGGAEFIAYSLTSQARMARTLAPDAQPVVACAELAGGAVSATLDPAWATGERPALRLKNPLSPDIDVLRTSAVAAALETLRDNLRHVEADVLLFEIGRIYLPREGDLPEERRVLTVVMGGWRTGRELGERVEADFFDLKGVAEELLRRLGVAARFVPATHPTFHPGRTAVIVAGDGRTWDDVLGILGEVHPLVREQMDLPEQRAYLLVLDLPRLRERSHRPARIATPPRFPPVVMDIALVVDEAVPAGRVERVLRAAGGDLLADLRLFDVYRGPTIPEGTKSLAYRVTYQAHDRTLTDEEARAVHDRLAAAARREVGARVRGVDAGV